MTDGSQRQAWLDAARDAAARMARVAEVGMRASRIRQHLGDLNDAEALWHLDTWIRGALHKERACLLLYDCLVDPGDVAAVLPRDRRERLIHLSAAEGCAAAVQWLRSPDAESPATLVAEERLVDKELRQLTLGDRRARARRAGRDLLQRLVSDPDPVVIEHVLNNPRVTERLVLAICSRRPTVAAPLRTVLKHRRWSARYAVRLALAKNPHMDPTLAVNVLVYLQRQDLWAVEEDETLPEGRRYAARCLRELLLVSSTRPAPAWPAAEPTSPWLH